MRKGEEWRETCLHYKLLGCPAKQQNEQRISEGQSWMGPDSAGTNSNSRVRFRPETKPDCCSTPPPPWHPRVRPCPSGGWGQLEYCTGKGMKSSRARCLPAESPARAMAPCIFVTPAAALPSALLSSSAGGSNWERNLLWQMCGRLPPWLTSIRDNPLPLQLCWKLFLPANLEDLGLSQVRLQKSLVSHK